LTLLAPLLLTLLAADAERVLVAVPDLVALGVKPEMAQNLTAVIAAELGRYDDVRAISSREMGVLLGAERQKALLGCTDESCTTQLADALGAGKILSGQIGTVEQSIVFTLQLTNVKTASVEGRVVKVVPLGKNQIVDAVRAAVTQLMGTASSRNKPPRMAVSDALVGHQHERIILDASRCYDPDGDPLTSEWHQVDGPPALLEGVRDGAAAFTAEQTGVYTFVVSVTDGRSEPIEQKVAVEVLPRRQFVIGLGGHVFAPFNRLVERDGAGNQFRNRTPYGTVLGLGLWLSDRWQLTIDGEFSHMHTFTEDVALEGFEHVDYYAFNLLFGSRVWFPFGAFNLWLGASGGSVRLFLHIKEGDAVQNPSAQAVIGELAAGAGLPLGERFGVQLKVGMRAQINTEPNPPLKEGIDLVFEKNGVFWGFETALVAYVRL
jgi:hypothetical protein